MKRVAKGQKVPSLEILHPESFKKIKTVVKRTFIGLGEAFALEYSIENNDFYVLFVDFHVFVHPDSGLLLEYHRIA